MIFGHFILQTYFRCNYLNKLFRRVPKQLPDRSSTKTCPHRSLSQTTLLPRSLPLSQWLICKESSRRMVRKFTNLVLVNRLSQYQPLCKKLWLKIHTKKITCMSKVYQLLEKTSRPGIKNTQSMRLIQTT